jgi:hypothetical protein
MFECQKCYKIFKYNYLFEKHQSNRIKCDKPQKIIKNLMTKIEQIDNNIDNLEKISLEAQTTCFYCNEIFTYKYNLTRHLNNRCDSRRQLIEDKNKYNDMIIVKKEEINKNNIQKLELKEELKQCKKEIKKMQKNIIINNNNNMNVVMNNNVIINSFGKEDLSHITDEKYKQYIKKLFPGVLSYIKDVHFSPEKPENHNICIPKLNSKSIAIYENGQWNAGKKQDIIHKLLSKKITILDSKSNKLDVNNEINKKDFDAYNDFITEYYSNDKKKKVYNDVALLLYNNRKNIDNYNNLIE